MSAPAATSKRPSPGPVDAGTLRRRLAAVRQRLRLVNLIRGLGWVVGALLLGLLAGALLDYRWSLPALVRALFLVGSLAAAGVLAVRHLVGPLSAKDDDLTLALKVEEEYPALNDALASAVQFLDQPETPNGESEAMRKTALRQTLHKSASCDFFRIIDTRGLRLAGLTGLAAVVAVAALGVFFPSQAGTAFVRLVDPFGKHAWPTQTQLAIDPPPRRVALNDSLDVTGTVRGVIPADAKLTVWAEGFPVREQVVKVIKDREDEGRLAIHLTSSQLQRSFKFQVAAGDATSDVYEVSVLPPPGLAFLDGRPSPQVRLDYPAYTGLPTPRFLQPGTGHIDAIAGTRVTVTGAADRPLKRVWLEPRYEPRLPPYLLALAGPFGAAVAPLVHHAVEGELGDDGQRFRAAFQPLLAGEYLLHLEDDTGLRGSRAFELRIRPDPAPLVTLDRPSASKDFLLALPAADVPVAVVAEDTTFAVRTVFLRYRTHRDHPARILPLYTEQTATRTLGQAAGPALVIRAPHYRPTRLALDTVLSLKRIAHPDGKPLKDGDTLFLQACADDFDAVSPNKEPGASSEVEIKIVDRNRLELTFSEEQAKIQQELLRLREKQREILKTTHDLKARLDQGQKLTPDEQRALAEAERQQGVLQEKVGPEDQGLRGNIARLLETLKQNGLENSPDRDRLADIATELERIAANELPKVQAALGEARKAQDRGDNPTERKDAADKLRREAQMKLDRADALKRNDPAALDQAGDKIDRESRIAEAKGNIDKARELHAEAAQLRQQAKDLRNNPVEPEAKATKDEVARLEQQAKDLKEAAEQVEQLPMLSKEETTQKNLADAKVGQEEVDRTLTDLLSRLEPWSSDRELKGEANKLLQEQKNLIQKNQQLDGQQGGKQPDKLTPAEQAELRNQAEEQQKLEQRTNQLLQKIENVANQRAEKDPERAAELKQAAEQARQDNIAGKMQDAQRETRQNQLSRARENQKAAAAGLEKALKNLDERREDKFDRLAKKLREVEQEVEKIQDELEKLKKQRKDAEKIADPQKREQELQRLQKEQERLQNKARDAAQQLAKLRQEGGARGLDQAQKNLEEAVKQLQRRDGDEKAQDEALDRIEEARQELQEAREQAEEQLAREQLVRVMEVLKRLKERQDGMIAEGKRLQEALQLNPRSRPTLASLARLSDDQKGLAGETQVVAERDLDNAPVFSRMVRRAAEGMTQAGERAKVLTQGKEPFPDADLPRLQELAARRLAQVLQAVQEEVDAPRLSAPASGGGGGGDMGGGDQRPAPGDHLPPLAELKLLKILEADVRDQIAEFRKDHPDLNNLDAKAQARYQGLLRQRQDVRELFEELNKPDDEPEAKPEPKPEGDKP